MSGCIISHSEITTQVGRAVWESFIRLRILSSTGLLL